jgi:nucleoside-diphosphate-sugar epimerase
LNWTIYRLGAALPVRLVLDPDMFNVPLDNRIEFVHTRDVGLAIANGLVKSEIWGRVWHIGGGPDCQLFQRDIVEGVLDAVGIGMLPEEAFTDVPFPTDWLDTAASEDLLHFQRHTLKDYIQDLTKLLGYRRYFIQMFRPLIRSWLIKRSPVLSGNHP